jgi:SPP1 family predicted phage head-tail adaptor
MRAGKLRHFVTIERKTGARDPDGGERVSWALLETRWAEIKTQSSREFYAAQQAQSEITSTIRFRYPCQVRADDRVVYKGQIYNVHSTPETDMLKREVLCMVSEGVNDGV